MKVLNVISYYNDSFYHDMMIEMKKQNIDVSVLFTRRHGTEVTVPMEDFVYEYQAFNSIDRIVYFSKELKSYNVACDVVRKVKPDLIHAHTLFSDGYVAYKIWQKFNIPYIVAVRASDVNIFFKYRLNLRGIGRKILVASRILCK